MTDDFLFEYVHYLRKMEVGYLIAYPSSAFVLAQFCIDKKLELPNLRAIVVSSEKLLVQWREVIETAFPQAELVDFYGNNEQTVSLTSCRQCRGFHIHEDYGQLELISIGDDRYEIGGTGFFNRAFPMVRYNTQDVFLFQGSSESRCELGSRVIHGEIEGRSTDLIFTGDRFLPGVNFFTLFYHYSDSIHQFQLVQNEEDSLEVRLVPRDPTALKAALPRLAEDLKRRVGPHLKLHFVEVASIERNLKTGKVKNIISAIRR